MDGGKKSEVREDKPASKRFGSEEKPAHLRGVKRFSEEDQAASKKKPAPSPKRTELHLRKEDVRRLNKLDIKAVGDSEEVLARPFKRMSRHKKRTHGQSGDFHKVVKEVLIPETIVVQELANRMSERAGDTIKALLKMGVMVTINQTIEGDTAELVAEEMGHRVKRVSDWDVERDLMGEEDEKASLQERAPVVTIMGHVDHGKTSLLDALRKTNIALGEAGGITQHIGAYQVIRPGNKSITFIDTPGHAAFTKMRSRGANVTDIVLLVVAADDGVKDQTIEAIHHVKAAKASMILVINKIDKPASNPQQLRQMLLQHGIVVESLGGDTLEIEVSAKTGHNLEKLEELVLLQSEILELKANPNRLAAGVIIEAKLERGRGPVATVLVQRGTLKPGDIFVSGKTSGRVRVLTDDCGKKVDEALPSVPVEVIGFSAPPASGDDFVVVATESKARAIAQSRLKRVAQDPGMLPSAGGLSVAGKNIAELLLERQQQEDVKELHLVVKADVQGSLEAIVGGLENISTPLVKVRILHGAVGAITESDISLAKASNAFIVGFNVRAHPQEKEIARRLGLEIRYYSVIYHVMDDIKVALSGLLSPILKEKILGTAQVRHVFNISKVGKIAGCMVRDGVIRRGCKARLLRDQSVIHEGVIKNLKIKKDEVKEAKEGYECGICLENYHDIRENDCIECFEIESIQRTLS